LAIYRGAGGAGDAVGDASSEVLLALQARDAALAAQAAAEAAQVAAELAETNAETAETNAETAETNAETAETNAETAQAAAEVAQAAAEAVLVDPDFVAVAAIEADITTVAGIAADVTTVAGISADVTAVAAIDSDVSTVASDIADVTTVASNIGSVNTVSGISSNVTTVAGISSNVTTVAGISSNVTTVAGISGNVTTVAGISSNVTTVAGISADVTTVAGDSADIQLLADNIATIAAKANAGANSDITSLSGLTTPLSVGQGGTGANTLTGYVKGAGTTALTASSTIPNTDISGLGTMSTQAASNVAITGGSINGTTVGATTAAAGKFTTLEATGVTTVQAGTVSAPAITTSGDTNTGIYFPAADTIAFTEGGTESMRIDSSGNLVVGGTQALATSANRGNITINGSSTSILSFGSSNVLKAYIYSDGTNFDINNQAVGYMSFQTSGTERMRITSAGNVGIGTSSPFSSGSYRSLTIQGANTSNGGLVQLQNSDSSCQAYWFVTSSLSEFKTVTNHALALGTNNTERMRIDTSGNLGLGVTPSAWTSSFSTKAFQFSTCGALYGLEVSSSDRRVGIFNNAFINASNANTYLNTGVASWYQQAAGQHVWYNAPSGTAGTAVTFTQAMTLDASGNLGVGTTSASNGMALARGAGVQAFLDLGGNGNAPTSAGMAVGQWTDSSGYCWNRANAALLFGTNNTERGRFDTSGNFQFNSGYGSVATAYGCRAWVNFNGTGTVAIRSSGNVSSITDNGTGNYTVNFTNSLTDANYAVHVTGTENNTGEIARIATVYGDASTGASGKTSSAVRVVFGASNAATFFDSAEMNVACFR